MGKEPGWHDDGRRARSHWVWFGPLLALTAAAIALGVTTSFVDSGDVPSCWSTPEGSDRAKVAPC